MAWELEFVSQGDAKPNIGTLLATFDKGQPTEFVHQGSVNMESADSCRKVMAEARELQLKAAEATEVKHEYGEVVRQLEAEMNK